MERLKLSKSDDKESVFTVVKRGVGTVTLSLIAVLSLGVRAEAAPAVDDAPIGVDPAPEYVAETSATPTENVPQDEKDGDSFKNMLPYAPLLGLGFIALINADKLMGRRDD